MAEQKIKVSDKMQKTIHMCEYVHQVKKWNSNHTIHQKKC